MSTQGVKQKVMLAPQMRVRIYNLQKDTRYNGLVGTLGRYLKKVDRWEIELDEKPGKLQEIDAKHLTADGVTQLGPGLAPGVRVKIWGLKEMPAYNGQHASVIKYRDDIDKWVIMLDSKHGKVQAVDALYLTTHGVQQTS